MTLSTAALRSAEPRPEPDPLQRVRPWWCAVLVLRALGLGDALTAVPALRGLRRAWPDRWLMLATDAAIGEWLRTLGLIDEVLPAHGLRPLPWPPRGMLGDGGHLAVNLHGSGPQSHLLLSATTPDRLIAFRQPGAGFDDGPAWHDDEHEVDRWCRLVTTAGGPCGRTDLRLPAPGRRTSEIVLHPGAAAPARRWPAERWARLAADLLAAGHPVVLTGGVAETELCGDIVARARELAGPAGTAGPVDTAGRLDLPELADRVGRARMLVCGDTGVAHLATAFRTPSVLLFGPTSPHRWGPAIDPGLHTVLWHGDPAHPGDPHGVDLDPALAAIEVDQVRAAVAAAAMPPA